jgi:DNA-binding NtrC family response regulator
VSVCELVFRQSGRDLLHFRVDRAETCLGPHPTNDVIVPNSTLPDVTAVLIDRGAEQYTIRSLAPDRVCVNDQVLNEDECPLRDEDIITIGEYVLVFRIRKETGFVEGQTKVLSAETKADSQAILTYDHVIYEIDASFPFNIGSSTDNQLVVTEDFVSSYHCRISCREGRWMLIDLASTNGTQINGLKAKETELPSRAHIQLGGTAKIEFATQSNLKPAKAKHSYGMKGADPKMLKVFELIEKFAPADAPVLITGRSGSGKELVARALHDASVRKKKPYLAINCGALAASIIEGELFGHVKGAFTGADSEKMGAFEATRDGTLFLDEIGEMPLDLQPKLLRVLESSTVRRVGGNREIKINTRIVAATHRNLKELVQDGGFREDLFHRLFVLNIAIPPLAERAEDILMLANTFLTQQAPDRDLSLSANAIDRLLHYTWPGNIRELKNMMLRAVLLTQGPIIEVEDLEFSDTTFFSRTASQRVRAVDSEERDEIMRLLKENSGNRSAVARILDVSKSTFHDKLRRLGIPNKFGK